MIDFFETVTTTPLAILFPVVFIAITWLGLIFVRPFLRLMLSRQTGINELVGHASAGFSLLYGLLLGLLSVAAFDNNARINSAVHHESASLALLYRGASSYEEPLRSELKYLLRDYTFYVVERDWPAQREGFVPTAGASRLDVIRDRMITFEPQTSSEEILQEQLLGHFNNLMEARVERISGVDLRIPGVFWYVVIIGAIIQIVLILILDMRFFTQMLLGGLVAFFLGVMFFLIYALDEPLQGPVSIPPENFEQIFATYMQLDETQ